MPLIQELLNLTIYFAHGTMNEETFKSKMREAIKEAMPEEEETFNYDPLAIGWNKYRTEMLKVLE